MEIGLNCKAQTSFDGQNPALGIHILEGVDMDFDRIERRQKKKMQAVYQPPIELRNFVTRDRQAVLSGLKDEEFDAMLHFSDKAYNGPVALRIDDFPMEFKADVWRALLQFNKPQQKFLLNVLVKGMAIELAAKLTKRSKSHWQDWLTKIALPALRESLKDYCIDGKLVLRGK